MSRDHAGRGLLSLGVSCGDVKPWRASFRKGLAKAAIIGQSGNGLRSIFRTRTSCVRKTLGIIRERLIDKAPGLGLACGSLGVLSRKGV